MRSTNLCTPILINDSTCKIVATAYATAHMSKSIFSIPALISIAIRCDVLSIIHYSCQHWTLQLAAL